MKKTIWIIGVGVIVGLLIFKLVSNKKATESKLYVYDKEKPITVQVDRVRVQPLDDLITYTGTFEPNKESKISADIQGKINTIFVDVGSYVSTGQTLLQLDSKLLSLQLQAVEVQIEGLAYDVNRYTILTEADAVQGIQLEKAKLGLKSAKIQKATILEQINKTSIKAPFNGVITAKFNEEGSFAGPGVPLLQITDISTLRFTVHVPENDLLQFQNKQAYQIYADAYPSTSLSGIVIMIGSKANIGNSFPVQFQLANINNTAIKSGMFGKVHLSDKKQERGIQIPTSTIIEENGIAQVYLLKNEKAVLKTIHKSNTTGSKTLISDGLKEGDVLITSGFVNLFDGANVRVK